MIESESMHGWRFDEPLYDLGPPAYGQHTVEEFVEYLLERCKRTERDRDQARRVAKSLQVNEFEFDYDGYDSFADQQAALEKFKAARAFPWEK